jgi:hypothetical protein
VKVAWQQKILKEIHMANDQGKGENAIDPASVNKGLLERLLFPKSSPVCTWHFRSALLFVGSQILSGTGKAR